MKKPEYYTLQDVANLLSCSYDTVRAWTRCGRLECTKVGRFVRISPQQLDKFMKENANGGDSMKKDKPELYRPLYDKDGKPRYTSEPEQPKTCPHCGEPIEPVRGQVYTNVAGVYAIFEDGKPTGQFIRTVRKW